MQKIHPDDAVELRAAARRLELLLAPFDSDDPGLYWTPSEAGPEITDEGRSLLFDLTEEADRGWKVAAKLFKNLMDEGGSRQVQSMVLDARAAFSWALLASEGAIQLDGAFGDAVLYEMRTLHRLFGAFHRELVQVEEEVAHV